MTVAGIASRLRGSSAMVHEDPFLTPALQTIPGPVPHGPTRPSRAQVFMGSAYKNKGVQLLLDGVRTFLPSPLDVNNVALDVDNAEAPLTLPSNTQGAPASVHAVQSHRVWGVGLRTPVLLER